MAFDYYYYDSQIKGYLIQFMSVFAGMKVMIGANDNAEQQLIDVPVHYGNKDRVVASILSDNTQNKPLRLPVMSVNLSNIALAPELRKGVGTQRRNTYLPQGKVFPDDIQTVRQYMPVPYKAFAELAIYASNTEQRLQILEQILMLFDPIIQIQKNDNVFDWTKLTSIELTDVRFDDNYPSGADRRMLVSSLDFTFPIYLSAPANIKKDFVKDIFVRLTAVDQISAGSSQELLDEINDQGVDYEKWFSADDVILP